MASISSLRIVKKSPLEEAKELNAQGLLLATGCDMPQDHCWAMIFFKKAAQLGDSDALYNLAIAYEYGLGVAVDLALAMEYQLEAAQRGSDRPENFLKIGLLLRAPHRNFLKLVLKIPRVIPKNCIILGAVLKPVCRDPWIINWPNNTIRWPQNEVVMRQKSDWVACLSMA